MLSRRGGLMLLLGLGVVCLAMVGVVHWIRVRTPFNVRYHDQTEDWEVEMDLSHLARATSSLSSFSASSSSSSPSSFSRSYSAQTPGAALEVKGTPGIIKEGLKCGSKYNPSLYNISCQGGAYCCPKGSYCTEAGGCRFDCPSDYPVDCGETLNYCCPAGTVCNSSSYGVCMSTPLPLPCNSSSQSLCPAAGALLDSCCPSDSNCSSELGSCLSAGFGCDPDSSEVCSKTGICCPRGWGCQQKTPTCFDCAGNVYCENPSASWCCLSQCGDGYPMCTGCVDAEAPVRVLSSSFSSSFSSFSSSDSSSSDSSSSDSSSSDSLLIVTKSLRDVRIGDWVESVEEHNGQLVRTFAQVYFVAHENQEQKAALLQINTVDTSVKMTPHHLLLRTDATAQQRQVVRADDIKAGDWILLLATEEGATAKQVVSVSQASPGPVRTPLTASGRIVVSSVVCSVYAHNELFYSLALWPVKTVAHFFPLFWSSPVPKLLLNSLISLSDLLESWLSPLALAIVQSAF